LPFYTGIVTYKLNVDQYVEEGKKIFISLPNFEAACVKVTSPSSQSTIIAWQPYEADITDAVKASSAIDLNVILTRRNVFGPLHQVPAVVGAYGPGNFVTGGKAFSESYMLIPSGLLAPPIIGIRG